MKVKKRNGRLEDFNPDKINQFVERACEGLDGVSPSEIILDAEISFRDKIPTTEIDKTLELTARSKSYKEPNYSYVAARIVLTSIYKEVLKESVDSDTFDSEYRNIFIRNIKKGVKQDLFHPDMVEKFDLQLLANYLDPSRDKIFKYVGIRNIYDRYLAKLDKKVIETPQAFYMRVAMGLSLCEKNPTEAACQLYDIYSKHLASPSTPTLFNSGTVRNQLCSCYLQEVDDSIDGIFDGLWQAARKSKFAGGLGFHMGGIRGTNAYIKGTNGTSSGLIPWLKVYNDMLISTDQSGRRKGSGCVYIEPWHLDVEEYLELRRNIGDERRKCHDLNIALWMPDLFYQRVKEDGYWTLFCPADVSDLLDLNGRRFKERYEDYESCFDNNEIRGKRLQAKDLWKKMLKCLFETSHPWQTFKDAGQIRYPNKHVGLPHGSNLCTETFLRSESSIYSNGKKIKVGITSVCVLGSICLPNHMTDNNGSWKIDYESLKNTIHKQIRALDNAVTAGFYPTEESQRGAEEDRPLGLGTIGWANVFARLGIAQDSDEAVELSSKLMEYISYCAIEASVFLAKKRGVYPTYEGSSWSEGKMPQDLYLEYCEETGRKPHPKAIETLDWNSLRKQMAEYGMRNSTVLAIAPNASLAYLLGYEQSIEPFFSAVFRYENKSGNTLIVNDDMINEMKKDKIWSKDLAEAIKKARGDVLLLNLPDKYHRLYKRAFDRDQLKLIECTAVRQVWVDQAISFNLYNGGTSLKFLNDIYMHAWEMGLKSTYYLRNKPANEIGLEAASDIVAEKKIAVLTEQQVCSINNPEGCEMCEG